MRKDYSNLKFNYLTALNFHIRKNNATYWYFKCDCGTEKSIAINNVIKNRIKSCGCKKHENKVFLKNTKYGKRGVRFKDLLNKKFNRLEVIEFVKINKRHRAEWLCKCECGNLKILEGKLIFNGNVKSCGCLWKESISLDKNEASFNVLYLGYKNAAKSRNYSFLLSKEEFKIISSKNCYYCNSVPKPISNKKAVNGQYVGNGIDRVDNKIGYELNNCVACCKQCNIAKATMTKIEFLNLIKNIFNNLKLGEINE